MNPSDLIAVPVALSRSAPPVHMGLPLPKWASERSHFTLMADQNRVEPAYLLWALRHRLERIKEEFREQNRRGRLRMIDLLGIEIKLPDVGEQRRFARLLNNAERLRTLRNEADQARSGLRSAIYRRSFGVEPHEGFKRARLGDVTMLRTLGPADTHRVVLDRDGMIVIRATGSRCGAVEVLRDMAELTFHIIAITPKSPLIDHAYLTETLRQIDLRRFATGSVIPHLTTSILRNVLIQIPPLDRQRKFSADAKNVDAIDTVAANASQRVDWLGAAVMAMAFDGPAAERVQNPQGATWAEAWADKADPNGA